MSPDGAPLASLAEFFHSPKDRAASTSSLEGMEFVAGGMKARGTVTSADHRRAGPRTDPRTLSRVPPPVARRGDPNAQKRVGTPPRTSPARGLGPFLGRTPPRARPGAGTPQRRRSPPGAAKRGSKRPPGLPPPKAGRAARGHPAQTAPPQVPAPEATRHEHPATNSLSGGYLDPPPIPTAKAKGARASTPPRLLSAPVAVTPSPRNVSTSSSSPLATRVSSRSWRTPPPVLRRQQRP